MKTLITGAAGFIGSQLAHRLWQEKGGDSQQLILVDNFSYGKMDNLDFDDVSFANEIITMDIRDRDGIQGLLKDNEVEVIYNIAGIAPLPDCQTRPQEAVDVNINGFVNLLENARRFGVRKIVQASTNAIYENETEFPTREDYSKLPTLIYPNTKYCAERFAESYCKTYGMNITCLRFANVYGPHVDCLRKQPPFFSYMIRELYYGRTPVFYSNGEQRRDYIYVDDLIDLALAVRDSVGYECVNVSSNTNHSVSEMYSIAQELAGKSIPAMYNDSSLYWDKYPELYDGAFPISNAVLSHEVNKYTLCDNSYAKRQYNWSPKFSIEDGLRKCIEYQFELLARNEGKS